MTRLGDRLVRDGLIGRSEDPADRRAVVLSATGKGVRTADKVKTWRLGAIAERFGRVPPAERPGLRSALETCAMVLDAHARDIT